MTERERILIAEAMYWKCNGEYVDISDVQEFCLALDMEFEDFDIAEILLFLADKD